MSVSKLLDRHIKALEAIDGKTVEAGWFESNRYSDGTSVAYIARFLNDGGIIKSPERTQNVYRSMNEKTGSFNNGGRFVKASKSNYMTTHTVAAYNIIIPARPFMDKAERDFAKSLPSLQKTLGKKFLSGDLSADGMLNQIGLHLEGLIVDSMNNGGWAPNAKSTIARKGFDKPLKHWGTMIQTVTYKIIS